MIEAFVQNVEDEAVKNNVDLRGNQPGAGGVPGFPGVARAFFDRAAYLWRARGVSLRLNSPDRYALWMGQKSGGWGHIRTMSPPSAH